MPAEKSAKFKEVVSRKVVPCELFLLASTPLETLARSLKTS